MNVVYDAPFFDYFRFLLLEGHRQIGVHQSAFDGHCKGEGLVISDQFFPEAVLVAVGKLLNNLGGMYEVGADLANESHEYCLADLPNSEEISSSVDFLPFQGHSQVLIVFIDFHMLHEILLTNG